MQRTGVKHCRTKKEVLDALNLCAVVHMSVSDVIQVLDQLKEYPDGLCCVELPWWKANNPDIRKLLLLYFGECYGFRPVGTLPAFPLEIERRSNAAQCREEFREVSQYLQIGNYSSYVHPIPAKETKEEAKICVSDVKNIYERMQQNISEFEMQPTDENEGTYQRTLENRIIGARHVIYFGGIEEEVVNGALATLLCTNKLDDELLEIGWVRTNMPKVRVAYLLAYYRLYGEDADNKYRQLEEYVDHFAASEERRQEIRQVRACINNSALTM